MITVDRRKGIYIEPGDKITVGHRHGSVVLRHGDKAIGITTPVAVKVGLALVRLSDQVEQGEFLVLDLEGDELHLWPEHATQVGGALLRKADMADDWQRALHH